jgi:hypothetical protein
VQARVKQRIEESSQPLCGGSRNKGSNIIIINKSTAFKMPLLHAMLRRSIGLTPQLNCREALPNNTWVNHSHDRNNHAYLSDGGVQVIGVREQPVRSPARK